MHNPNYLIDNDSHSQLTIRNYLQNDNRKLMFFYRFFQPFIFLFHIFYVSTDKKHAILTPEHILLKVKIMQRQQVLMGQLMDLTNELVWLNRPEMQSALKGYKLNEIELLEKIELLTHPNVTKLANATYMTRGAISKLTKKLMEKELITSYQLPENKKEIYFRLTTQGEHINQTHQMLHQRFANRDKEVFTNMTDEEFDTVFRFIGRYREHLKKLPKSR